MICITCKKDKIIEEFGWRSKPKNIRQDYCRKCGNVYSRQSYQNNKEKRKEKIYARQVRVKKHNHTLILDYLSEHPCVDCGETDPIVLEFDHVRGDKKCNISTMMEHSENSILEEMKKCDVRCANCHKRRHAKENKNYKYLSVME